jgi:hypothetical protein
MILIRVQAIFIKETFQGYEIAKSSKEKKMIKIRIRTD